MQPRHARRSQVADEGAGVPEEMVPHLFTPYAQASKWRYGTGLGLHHVHELATALGGTVWHRRNEPHGAVFAAEVPHCHVDSPALVRHARVTADDRGASPPDEKPLEVTTVSSSEQQPQPATVATAEAPPSRLEVVVVLDTPPSTSSTASAASSFNDGSFPRAYAASTGAPRSSPRRVLEGSVLDEPPLAAPRMGEPPTVDASHHTPQPSASAPLHHAPSASAPPPAPEAAPAAAREAATPSELSELSVLVVEDDPFICELTVTLLQNEGVARVETAGDGEEGLQRLTSGPPLSLALIDLQMPVLDGIECVRQMRAWEAAQPDTPRRHTRTVAVSANSDDDGCRDDCLAAGFDLVESKPLSRDRLRDLLAGAETARNQ
jgi:CheY-like chemotaxis protein